MICSSGRSTVPSVHVCMYPYNMHTKRLHPVPTPPPPPRHFFSQRIPLSPSLSLASSFPVGRFRTNLASCNNKHQLGRAQTRGLHARLVRSKVVGIRPPNHLYSVGSSPHAGAPCLYALHAPARERRREWRKHFFWSGVFVLLFSVPFHKGRPGQNYG